MRINLMGMVSLAAGLCVAGPALASPCYVIYDRNDVVVFRDLAPPFDLSDPKSNERVALRETGHHLLIAEFDKCDPAGFISPTTGGTTATVDDIVQSFKPMLGKTIGRSVGSGAGTNAAPPQTASARGNAPRASAIRVVPAPKY